jgi:hypothetical protein
MPVAVPGIPLQATRLLAGAYKGPPGRSTGAAKNLSARVYEHRNTRSSVSMDTQISSGAPCSSSRRADASWRPRRHASKPS